MYGCDNKPQLRVQIHQTSSSPFSAPLIVRIGQAPSKEMLRNLQSLPSSSPVAKRLHQEHTPTERDMVRLCACLCIAISLQVW